MSGWIFLILQNVRVFGQMIISRYLLLLLLLLLLLFITVCSKNIFILGFTISY